MDKDIQMFDISDKSQPIGTEIFDNNLPSNIDFDQPQEMQSERKSFNPQKPNEQKTYHNKIVLNGDELKTYNIKGKAIGVKQPLYFKGAMIKANYRTHAAKVYDEEKSKGFMKLWESIVGYSKREILINQGYLYVLEKTKDGLFLHSIISLGDIFKIFIDPQQDKIRLAIRNESSFVNKDLSIEYIQTFLSEFTHELVKIGMTITHSLQ